MNTTVERELEAKGRTVIQTTGVSMEPLLHHRKSSVVLIKPDRVLKKNDVVLFRRGHELVLHRIIRILPDGRYVIKGDNCHGQDVVKPEAIIGRMAGYYPDESDAYVDCTCVLYRKYMCTVPLRHIKIRIEAILYGILKKTGLR